METKKEDGKVWVRMDRQVRHRLNLYKAVLGIVDDSVLDQSATIMALLDKVGAPGGSTIERIANPEHAAVAQ